MKLKMGDLVTYRDRVRPLYRFGKRFGIVVSNEIPYSHPGDRSAQPVTRYRVNVLWDDGRKLSHPCSRLKVMASESESKTNETV